jgi:acylphosphatase
VTRRYLVSGAVQGVGFRYFVLRRASALGLAGWARNLPDGRVEVVARGLAEALGTLEEALWAGPGHARVSGVENSEISDELADVNGFEIR